MTQATNEGRHGGLVSCACVHTQAKTKKKTNYIGVLSTMAGGGEDVLPAEDEVEAESDGVLWSVEYMWVGELVEGTRLFRSEAEE